MRRQLVLLLSLLASPAAAQRPSDLYRAAVAAAEGAIQVFDSRAALEWLRLAPAAERGWEWRHYATRMAAATRTDSLGLGPLSELEASPDGRFAAVGTSGGDLLLVEPGAAAPRTIARGIGFVYATTFSADSRLLAVGTADRRIRIYQLPAGTLLRTIPTDAERPLELAFDPAGARIAAAMSGALVRLWNVASGDSLRTLTGHVTRRPVPAVSFLPTGELISGSWDNHLRIWNLATGETVRTLGPGYGGRLAQRWSEVVVDPKGRYVAASGSDGQVHLWSTTDWTELTAIGHNGDAPALAVSPDGELLATGSIDQTVRVWRASDLTPVATWLGHQGTVQAVSFRADGRTLLSVGDDGALKEWSLDAIRRTVLPYETSSYAIAWLDPARRVAAGTHTGHLLVYDRADGRLLHDIVAHPAAIIGLAASRDGRRLVSLPQEGAVRIWDGTSLRPIRFLGDSAPAFRTLAMALTPDGTRIVTANSDRAIRVWDANSGTEIRRMTGDSARAPRTVALGRDGRTVFIGWSDGSASTWQLDSGTVDATLAGRGGPILVMAVEPRTGDVVMGSDRGEMTIWDGRSASPRARWHGHDGTISGLAVSATDGRIASAGFDGILRLWSSADGRSLATMRGLSAYCTSFSPDDRSLAVCGLDRQLRLLDAAPTAR